MLIHEGELLGTHGSTRSAFGIDATGAAHIQIVGEVPYSEIAAWYRGAELSVFPSYLETFGYPLPEAMAAEVPLVASDIPVFREIAGDAAFYADPHRPDELAAAMASALLSPAARETLVKRGRERLREFSWDATATRLLSLFENVLAKRATARLRRRAFTAGNEMLEQASV